MDTDECAFCIAAEMMRPSLVMYAGAEMMRLSLVMYAGACGRRRNENKTTEGDEDERGDGRRQLPEALR